MRPVLIASLTSALCAMALGPALAQTAPAARAAWNPPKNAFGQPDLSGYWSNATLTPLTRNRRLTEKPTLSREEARAMQAAFESALAERDEGADPNTTPGTAEDKAREAKLFAIRPDFAAAGGAVGGYNAFWLDPGTQILEVDGEFRTAIVTTPDGQIPKRKDGSGAADEWDGWRDVYDSYETRPLSERCIAFGRNAPPPMLPNGYYNNNYQILQTPDAVLIYVEHIHDARIVRLDGTHRRDGVRPWNGDSVGRYEGNTLVVETTNLPEAQAFYGAWKDLKVTERFTRVAPDRIHYRFEVEDPGVWEKPWGGEYVFHPLKGVLYEYACHEGNYSLPGILAGARRAEQEAAAKAATPARPRSLN